MTHIPGMPGLILNTLHGLFMVWRRGGMDLATRMFGDFDSLLLTCCASALHVDDTV